MPANLIADGPAHVNKMGRVNKRAVIWHDRMPYAGSYDVHTHNITGRIVVSAGHTFEFENPRGSYSLVGVVDGKVALLEVSVTPSGWSQRCDTHRHLNAEYVCNETTHNLKEWHAVDFPSRYRFFDDADEAKANYQYRIEMEAA